MARDTPGLKADGRVYCEGCGTVHGPATALLAELRETVQSLSSIISQRDGVITALRNGVASAMERKRNYPQALEVLDHWHAVCSPKAREPHNEPRVKAVLARMGKMPDGFTVSELKRAADGYARRPYVVDGRRVSRGKPNQRWCDAELIYRTAHNVEKGLMMADQQPELPARYDWRQVRSNTHATILRALPGAIRIGSELVYQAECPRCKGTLEICDPHRAVHSLLRCSGCRINETTFLSALRDDDGRTGFDPRIINAFEEMAHRWDRVDRDLEALAAERGVDLAVAA